MQQPAAEALAEVIGQCVGRKPSPNERLIKNLVTLTCADPVETPQATPANAAILNEESEGAGTIGKNGSGTKQPKLPAASISEERSKMEGAITRRGAELALKALCDKFGSSLFDRLLKLWDCLTESLGPGVMLTANGSCYAWSKVVLPDLKAEPQALINNLQVGPQIFHKF